jgi:hypothetical protein
VSRDDVNPARLGFIGHSYGGRMALWAPAFDPRITASVSNCGCIPYRHSHTHDTGIQAEFVVPGFAAQHDLEDVISRFGESSSLLISAGTQDKWSRGAQEVYDGAPNIGRAGRARALRHRARVYARDASARIRLPARSVLTPGDDQATIAADPRADRRRSIGSVPVVPPPLSGVVHLLAGLSPSCRRR